jgi:hypothetical protein
MNNADQRGRYFQSTQYPTGATQMGDTRGFSRLWDEDSMVEPAGDPTGWGRGQIVRSSQPMFLLTQLGPMYDVAARPESWRPGL